MAEKQAALKQGYLDVFLIEDQKAAQILVALCNLLPLILCRDHLNDGSF